MGPLAYVNGKWLHVDRGPEVTTATGAVVVAFGYFAALVLFGVLLHLFDRRRARGRAKRRRSG
jgi:hypothetical protein